MLLSKIKFNRNIALKKFYIHAGNLKSPFDNKYHGKVSYFLAGTRVYLSDAFDFDKPFIVLIKKAKKTNRKINSK